MYPFEEPDESAPPGLNADRHFEAVSAFYLSHPWLTERVPLLFAEEVSPRRLRPAGCWPTVACCHLVEAERGSACWLIENDLS